MDRRGLLKAMRPPHLPHSGQGHLVRSAGNLPALVAANADAVRADGRKHCALPCRALPRHCARRPHRRATLPNTRAFTGWCTTTRPPCTPASRAKAARMPRAWQAICEIQVLPTTFTAGIASCARVPWPRKVRTSRGFTSCAMREARVSSIRVRQLGSVLPSPSRMSNTALSSSTPASTSQSSTAGVGGLRRQPAALSSLKALSKVSSRSRPMAPPEATAARGAAQRCRAAEGQYRLPSSR